jgi:hypothetical protein
MSSAPTGSSGEGRPGRQLLLITAGAVAVFAGLRALPTGTDLSHMDFRVEARGMSSIEFCDPLNPQFIPVVAVRSPVTMALRSEGGPLVAGARAAARVSLRTASGKPIGAQDLRVTHTRRLHLLIVSPDLTDYQHVHPEPAADAGEWAFVFTPRRAGTYRVFADFTPAATDRGLYASVDVEVEAGAGGAVGAAARPTGFNFELATEPRPLVAGRPLDLRFSVTARDVGAVALEPVMGAYAHLVAFDAERSGFAHLHPVEGEGWRPPDPARPVLNFKLTIPRPGRYVVWAQVRLAGVETFVPFEVQVAAAP